MTAVASLNQPGSGQDPYNPQQSRRSSAQLSPQQSRSQSQSYTSSAQTTRTNSENVSPTINGVNGTSGSRMTVNGDQRGQAARTNGHSVPEMSTNPNAARVVSNAPVLGERYQQNHQSSPNSRPPTAPGVRHAMAADSSRRNSAQDDGEMGRTLVQRPRGALQRAKSDFGPRNEDPDDDSEEVNQNWGARHGFEEHYNSEEYVSQLANVSRTSLIQARYM